MGIDAKAKIDQRLASSLLRIFFMTGQPSATLPFANLSSESIRKFAESMAREIILPDDARYLTARRVWNHAVDKDPAVIARCAGVEDVQRAIELRAITNC